MRFVTRHRSSRLVHGLFCSALFAILLTGAGTANAQGTPSLVCDERVLDFGTVRNVDKITHTFVLKNVGDVDLVIQRVRPTCGCTTTKLPRDTIPPGESVDLDMTLSLVGRQGHQRKSIYISSNDPTSPEYQLEVTGSIQREIEMYPAQLFFNQSMHGAAATRAVRVVFNTEMPCRITGVATGTTDALEVQVAPVIEGKEYRIDVSISSNAPVVSGYSRWEVFLETDHPTRSRLSVPVLSYVRKDINVIPPELVLFPPAPSGKQRPSPRLIVRSSTRASISILEITPPVPQIQVTKTQVRPEMIQIDIVPGVDIAELDGTSLRIVVQGADDHTETFVVPIRVRQDPRG